MPETQKLFYDDCFVVKYNRLRGLVPGVSCDSMTTTRSPTTNVDYFSFKLTEGQLYECWKIIHHKTAMTDVKMLNKLNGDENVYNRVEDLMLLIPSTSSKRLENSAWRAWAKERFQLAELNPAKLNWYKENDITWLYGPLIITEKDEDFMKNKGTTTPTAPSFPQAHQHEHHSTKPLVRSPSADSLSSLSSTESISSVDTASTSITSEDLTNFHSKPVTKPILKTADPHQLQKLSFDELRKLKSSSDESLGRRKKRVSFNSVMEKREIIDDEVFDYNLQFIDNERIGYGYY